MLWIAAGAWLTAVLMTLPAPRSPVATAGEAIQALALVIVAAVSAWTAYRARGLVVFVAIAAVVSFLAEACSIATGFPFGHYTHHTAGPAPLGVPIPVVAGWVVLAWLAWTVARALTRGESGVIETRDRFTTPLVAAFVLGGYDFVLDPVAGTVRGLYSYASPSGQFGVPLTNFLGWLLTGWVICQLFALVERRVLPAQSTTVRAGLLVPCLIWLLSAFVPYASRPYAHDDIVIRGDRRFVTEDIYQASLASALFTMVPLAGLALLRLTRKPAAR
ncbi:carotenoid biosynthesis protein [Nocardia aurantia]|uniref:carotenoid biosynthesis protein n=1 Tax=Nocardia aurantia TaxID=2585199 RepID=UPI001296E012|nr:carotenoid biosynthesis protein [Nocardia aurantia]